MTQFQDKIEKIKGIMNYTNGLSRGTLETDNLINKAIQEGYNLAMKEVEEILKKGLIFKDNMKTLNNERVILLTESKFKEILGLIYPEGHDGGQK